MNLQPYPKYQKSNIEWIDQIPEKWSVDRNKAIFYEIKQPSPTGKETLLSVSDKYGIRPRKEIIDEDDHLSNAETLVGYKKCKTGDLICNIMLAWKGAIGHSKWDGICSPAYNVYRIKKENPKYFHYLFRTKLLRTQFKRFSTGIMDSRLRLYADEFFRLYSIIPPKDEQGIIVKYLEKKNREIDLMIKKNLELIELLKEKRIVLINETVTEGLDSKTQFIDSQIDFIERIPKHWNPMRMKFIVYVNPSTKKGISNPNEKVNFLPMEKVSTDGQFDSESKAPYSEICSGFTYFENDDVLIAKITPCFENGKGALVYGLSKGFGFGTTEFHVLRSKNDSIPKYLFYISKSHLFRTSGEAFMEGAAGQKRVTTEFIKNFRIPLPPKSEQIKIIKFLDIHTKKIDNIITKTFENIELLEEYRRSIIHHVVTGKLDVREAV